MRLEKLHGLIGTLSASLAMPAIARAEPAPSMSHLPVLWTLAAAISAWLAWIGVRIAARSGRLQTPMRKWVFAIILLVIFLLFVAPFFVGVGSILITGRTM